MNARTNSIRLWQQTEKTSLSGFFLSYNGPTNQLPCQILSDISQLSGCYHTVGPLDPEQHYSCFSMSLLISLSGLWHVQLGNVNTGSKMWPVRASFDLRSKANVIIRSIIPWGKTSFCSAHTKREVRGQSKPGSQCPAQEQLCRTGQCWVF